MPIRIKCPHCQASMRVADEKSGKRVRCSKCEGVIDVDDCAQEEGITPPAKRSPRADKSRDDAPRRRRDDDDDDRPRRRDDDEDDRPRRRARDDVDDDDDRRPRRRRRRDDDDEPRGGLPLGLIIGGAVGAGVLLIVVVVLVMTGSQPNPPLAQNNPPPEQPAVIAPPQNNNNVNPQANNNAPKNNQAVPKQANNEPAPKPPPKLPVQNPAPPVVEPPPPLAWNVKPDPLAKPLEAPQKPQGLIPLSPGAKVLFPRTPSPFVALVHNNGLQVWNMYTGQKTGEVVGRVELDEISLSPDGKYFAGKVNGFGPTRVDVRSAVNGQQVRQFVVHKDFKPLQLADFAGPEQLATVMPGDGFGKNEWKIWDIGTGQELRQFADGGNNLSTKKIAFSPARRYVAVPNDDQKIGVWDLSTGQSAGGLNFPPKEGFGNWQCEGLTFAADGSELAGVFTHFDKSRIVSWKVADGQVAVDHTFPVHLERSIQGLFGYQAPPLDWMPERSGWLAYGHLLIDYGSGGIIFSVPTIPGGLSSQPRRLIGKYHLALVAGNIGASQFQIAPLPKEQIVAGLQAAQKEADPNAGKLPDVAAADWTALEQLPPAVGAVAWSVQPDPATPPKALAARPIPLRCSSGDIAHIAFSSPAAGQVAVISAASRNPAGKKTTIAVDRCELASGKLLGTLELFAVDNLKDRSAVTGQLSPDGSRLVVKEPTSNKRLDVWSLKDSKHLVGWLPFEKEADSQLRSALWVDNDHLLTQGMGGRLVLWKVPECKAIYSTMNMGTELSLSAGRKYAAIFNGATFEVLEAMTGKRCGQLAAPPMPMAAMNAVAFSADGKKLAAFVQPGPLLARWDLSTGQLDGVDNVNHYATSELRWCTPNHLLAGTSLIDLNLKSVLWQYMMPGSGKHAVASPDGRLWYAFSANGAAPAVLVAQAIPDPQALAFSAQVAAGQVRTLFGPSKRVRLQINGGDGDFQNKVTQSLTDGLRAIKVEVAGDGELALSVQVDERDTGKTIELQSFGVARKNWTVPIVEVNTRTTLADNTGRTIWERSNKSLTSSGFGIIRTDDPLQYFREQLWNSVRSSASVRPPSLIVEVGGQPRPLPMASTLAGS